MGLWPPRSFGAGNSRASAAPRVTAFVRASRALRLLGCAFALVIAADSVLAQTSTYNKPDQVAALETLVNDVLGVRRAALGLSTTNDQILLDFAQLLSDPCDELRWLEQQTGRADANPSSLLWRGLSADDDRDALAERFHSGVAARVEALRNLGLLGACADFALPELPARPQPVAGPTEIWQETDPQKLLEGLRKLAADPSARGALTDAQRFVLLSRGATLYDVMPDAMAERKEIAFGGKESGWDYARQMVLNWDSLELLRQRPQDLIKSLSKFRDTQTSGPRRLNDAAYDPMVAATDEVFDMIVWGLIGADGQDLRDPRFDQPDHWERFAIRFEGEQLWLWAALSRTLQAGLSSGPAQNAARTAASESMNKYREVAQTRLRAIDGLWDSNNLICKPGQDPSDSFRNLLNKIRNAANAAGEGVPFLVHASRSDQRRRRAELERQAANANNADAALQAMQRAKAADMGINVNRFATTRDVQAAFPSRAVYAAVEILEIRGDGGRGAGQFYGVAVYCTDYRTTERAYESSKIGPLSSAQAVLQDALGRIPADQQSAEARILVAIDGPPDAGWFAAESNIIKQRCTSPPENLDSSWLIYVPSFAILVPNSREADKWAIEPVLASWMRIGGPERIVVGRTPLSVPNHCPTIGKVNLVATDGNTPQIDLKALQDRKSNGPVSILPTLLR